MAEKSTFASVVRNRGFLNLWFNQFLVQLSFNSLNFALIIWVFKLTDSNTAVSFLIFAIYLPAVILGLFSGVLVDITDRRKIIMMIDFFLCLLFFSLIFLKGSFPAILGVTFLINALAQFYAPAEASAIPIVVKKNQLLAANSLFSATLYSCFLLGFGLAGPLINHVGINFVFGLGGVFLAIAFLFSLMFPSIKSTPDAQGKELIWALVHKKYSRMWRIGVFEIKETIGLIRGKLLVLSSIVILAGVQMGIGIMAVLAPGFLEKSLQIKATDASYVLVIPLGLGIVIGGVVLGKFGSSLIKRRLVSRAILFAGLLLLLVGVAPQEDRGKVFSVLGVAMSGLSLIPIFLTGILADIFGTTPIFIALGLVIIVVGMFGLKPSLFFKKEDLSYKVREFLGLGHWEGK